MKVNGKYLQLLYPMTLQEFLETQGFYPNRVVTERNGEIVTQDAIANVTLKEDDVLEIITFMGGGSGLPYASVKIQRKKDK
ncbi:MAG: sulfur carrier protein ThiS [Ruminococcus sp.]|nr:sulfur carrier protein ThiS [Ruminococcus sp.]